MDRFQWDDEKKQYYDTETGKYLTETEVLSLLEEMYEGGKTAVAEITERAIAGGITAASWFEDIYGSIVAAGIASFAVGVGGIARLTEDYWREIGTWVEKQRRFLEKFAESLAGLTPAQAAARAGMYIDSSGEMYFRGRARSYGLPELPVYPRDGNSVCGSNCRCPGWRIVVLGDGDYDCFYPLDPEAENCEDCQERAALYNPLRVRGGQIVRVRLLE